MFEIIVITPEKNHPHEEQILHAIVRACSSTIHVRKPDFTEEEYRLYLTSYPSILSHMVLHEHHVLAKEFSVKGIHLKEADRKFAKEIPNDVKVISTSLHSTDDAKNISDEFEYIFYSPLFKSISKENYGADTTEQQLASTIAELKKYTTIPVIGLGGIHGENIGLVKKSGFDGAALLGAIWQSEDPLKTFDKIHSCIL
ncbi:thiamine phosphate synthase [Cytophaga aurantiaca]|uniref:thiamine phosphate synthase n=1 Tax=Cytophaga aurantiaca TaxID=29530 RepID=UPI0003680DE5|nr:thiamine phosphate synthase [Cytophaga aurantiaca]